MTLAVTLQEKLASWKPSGDGRHSWSETLEPQGWNVHFTVDHNDVVGAMVWELTLTRTGDAPNGLTMKQWAQTITERAHGLREELKVLEIDDTLHEGMLRSETPSRKGTQSHYYEVRLHGIYRAVVRRYMADTSSIRGREQISFALTHEVLADLIEAITQD